MAHHIAAWLGIPVGIVIAALVIVRKRGMELRTRRQQARAARQASAPAITPASARQQPSGTRPGHDQAAASTRSYRAARRMTGIRQ